MAKDRKSNLTLPYYRIVTKFDTRLLTGGSDHLDQDNLQKPVASYKNLNESYTLPIMLMLQLNIYETNTGSQEFVFNSYIYKTIICP